MSSNRVEKLSLRASSRESVQACLPLIEDAFNTASFRGVPPGAIVLVKRLQLGRIGRHSSSGSLSTRISELFDQAAKIIVNIDYVEAPEAELVYFSDAITAWARWLQVNLFTHTRKEWYWPCLGRSLINSTHFSGIQNSLIEIYRREGVLAHYRLLLQFAELRLLSAFLGKLAHSDVPRWPESNLAESLSPDLQAFVNFKSPLLKFFKYYARIWGREDPRTLWLARSICSAELAYQYDTESILQAVACLLQQLDDYTNTEHPPVKQHQGETISDEAVPQAEKAEFETSKLPAISKTTFTAAGNSPSTSNEQDVIALDNLEAPKVISVPELTTEVLAENALNTRQVQPETRLSFAGLFFLVGLINLFCQAEVRTANNLVVNIRWLIFRYLVGLCGKEQLKIFYRLLKLDEEALLQDDVVNSMTISQLHIIPKLQDWFAHKHSGRWCKLEDALQNQSLTVEKLLHF